MFKIQEIGRSPTPKKPITVYAVREDKDVVILRQLNSSYTKTITGFG